MVFWAGYLSLKACVRRGILWVKRWIVSAILLKITWQWLRLWRCRYLRRAACNQNGRDTASQETSSCRVHQRKKCLEFQLNTLHMFFAGRFLGTWLVRVHLGWFTCILLYHPQVRHCKHLTPRGPEYSKAQSLGEVQFEKVLAQDRTRQKERVLEKIFKKFIVWAEKRRTRRDARHNYCLDGTRIWWGL